MVNPLSSLEVANWFIEKSLENGDAITAMKLQKLVYFAHGWCLALYNTPLVDEQVEAWQYGPVFPDVYHSAKIYGSGPIKSLLLPSSSYLWPNQAIPSLSSGDPRIPILERVWHVYGGFSAFQLSNMTHDPNGPWYNAWMSNQGRRGTDIPEEHLKTYFSAQLPKVNP